MQQSPERRCGCHAKAIVTLSNLFAGIVRKMSTPTSLMSKRELESVPRELRNLKTGHLSEESDLARVLSSTQGIMCFLLWALHMEPCGQPSVSDRQSQYRMAWTQLHGCSGTDCDSQVRRCGWIHETPPHLGDPCWERWHVDEFGMFSSVHQLFLFQHVGQSCFARVFFCVFLDQPSRETCERLWSQFFRIVPFPQVLKRLRRFQDTWSLHTCLRSSDPCVVLLPVCPDQVQNSSWVRTDCLVIISVSVFTTSVILLCAQIERCS